MSTQQYIPGTHQGEWVPNPAYTGNKWKLFKWYPVTLLHDFKGEKKAKKGAAAFVHRVPSGQLYLSVEEEGPVFWTEAVEGVDFKEQP